MMTKLKIISCLFLLSLFHFEAHANSSFDLRGFLQKVIKSDLENSNKPQIGEIKIGCDEYDWCSEYKNYCSHPTIKTFCKGTCNTCPTPPPTTVPKICKDTEKFCTSFKRYCEFDLYKSYMEKRCAKTCGFCGQESIKCGIAKRRGNKKTNIIVGGETAKKGFYPWQVAIYYDNDFQCGGSLINKKFILTAAHCFRYLSTDITLWKVVLGEHNRGADEGTEVKRNVKKIIQHENYQHRADLNDMALIEMDKEVVFGPDVNAICLPKVNEILPAKTKCFVSGWGRTRSDGDSVELLQHVALPVADRAHCQKRNAFNRRVVNERMICAGYHDGMHYSSGCFGDSGGPLSCEQPDGSWKLYGVVSWGSPQCNGLDRYTVFSRVSKYVTWIKTKTS